MKNPIAEQQYSTAIEKENAKRKMYIYNPENKPNQSLTQIFGFNNGSDDGDYLQGILIVDDGRIIASCLSITEAQIPADLNMFQDSKKDLHNSLKLLFPKGYRMKFFTIDKAKVDRRIKKAMQLNQLRQTEQANVSDKPNWRTVRNAERR